MHSQILIFQNPFQNTDSLIFNLTCFKITNLNQIAARIQKDINTTNTITHQNLMPNAADDNIRNTGQIIA